MRFSRRRWDPHDILDQLVFRCGPAAAFPGRPALLGQAVGSAPFVRWGVQVAPTLPTSAAEALAGVADGVVAPRPLRPVVRTFACHVRARVPMDAAVAATGLVCAAQNRFELIDQVDDWDREAVSVAAVELLVAACDVVSGRLPVGMA